MLRNFQKHTTSGWEFVILDQKGAVSTKEVSLIRRPSEDPLLPAFHEQVHYTRMSDGSYILMDDEGNARVAHEETFWHL